MNLKNIFLILLLSSSISSFAQENYEEQCCDGEEVVPHPEMFDHKKLGYKNSYIKEKEEQFSGPNWAGRREDSFYEALTR